VAGIPIPSGAALTGLPTAHAAAAEGHAGHLVTFAGLVALFAILVAAEWHRATGRPVPLPPAVAGASLFAGTVHVAVMPSHYAEAASYGVFFLAAGLAQLALAGLLLARPGPAVVAAGALGNAGLIVLWALTRTLGIPLGPDAGTVEPVGAIDALCVAAEGSVVVLRVVWFRGRRRSAVGGRLRPADGATGTSP